jgi:extradiol dioxygenase family protein
MAQPIIVSLDEPPHVGVVLTTDTAWNGLAPGINLRVTHFKAGPQVKTSERSMVRSMLYVAAV